MPVFVPQFVPIHPHLPSCDSFTVDYLEAIEWTLDEEYADKAIGFSKEAIAKAKEDCEAFQEANEDDLTAYETETGYTGGVDLWLTRNHHGAGFWDRGLEDLGQRLTDAAQLGSQDAYLGNDNLIYLS